MWLLIMLLVLPPLADTNKLHYGWTYELSNTVKVTSKDGVDSDRHGKGLALCGDRAIVGSYADTFRSVQSGSAYVYKESGDGSWDVEAKLFPSLGNDDDYFGWSIACHQNYTFVGAYGDDVYKTDTGAVYMYEYTNGKWEEKAIFYSTSPTKNEHFGYSLEYHDDILVVGAPGSKALYTQCGAVYTFRRLQDGEEPLTTYDDDGAVPPPTGWILEAMLVPEDAGPYMNFGWSVSMGYGFLIVGAPTADLSAGAAYIYSRNYSSTTYYDDMYYEAQSAQYELLSRIKSPFSRPKTLFGCSVAMGQNVALVGQYLHVAYRDMAPDQEVVSGGAFLFRRGEFNQIGEWEPNDYVEPWGAAVELSSLVNADDYAFFGYSVSISANVIVVGAPGDGLLNKNATVHIFQSDNSHDSASSWHHTASWDGKAVDRVEHALHDNTYSRLGVAVTSSRGRLLIGDTNGLNSNGVRAGCAYALSGQVLTSSHGDSGNPPSEASSSEWAWLFLLIIPVVALLAGWYYVRKRDQDGFESMLHDGSNSKGFNDMSTRSGVDTSVTLTERISQWIKPISSHGADWMRNEMQPV